MCRISDVEARADGDLMCHELSFPDCGVFLVQGSK